MLTLNICESGPRSLPAAPESSALETWVDNDGAVCAYGYYIEGLHWMDLPGLARFAFDAAGDQVTAFVSGSWNEDCILDAYYRSVLPMALQVRGREVLHASAVRFDGGIVALCARSETGKSTIAQALGNRGRAIWADDAVVLHPSAYSVSVVPVPFRIRLRPASASFFELPYCDSLNFSLPAAPHNTNSSAERLHAIYVLERSTGTGVKIVDLSPAAAFKAILPHAYCFTLQDLDRKKQMMLNYLQLVQTVPVAMLQFPSGLENLAAVVDAVEEHAGRLS